MRTAFLLLLMLIMAIACTGCIEYVPGDVETSTSSVSETESADRTQTERPTEETQLLPEETGFPNEAESDHTKRY